MECCSCRSAEKLLICCAPNQKSNLEFRKQKPQVNRSSVEFDGFLSQTLTFWSNRKLSRLRLELELVYFHMPWKNLHNYFFFLCCFCFYFFFVFIIIFGLPPPPSTAEACKLCNPGRDSDNNNNLKPTFLLLLYLLLLLLLVVLLVVMIDRWRGGRAISAICFMFHIYCYCSHLLSLLSIVVVVKVVAVALQLQMVVVTLKPV